MSSADGAPGDAADDDPFAADDAEDAAGAVGLEELETFGTESQPRPPSAAVRPIGTWNLRKNV